MYPIPPSRESHQWTLLFVHFRDSITTSCDNKFMVSKIDGDIGLLANIRLIKKNEEDRNGDIM